MLRNNKEGPQSLTGRASYVVEMAELEPPTPLHAKVIPKVACGQSKSHENRAKHRSPRAFSASAVSSDFGVFPGVSGTLVVKWSSVLATPGYPAPPQLRA